MYGARFLGYNLVSNSHHIIRNMEQIIMTSFSMEQLRAELIGPLQKEIVSLKENNVTPETLLTRTQAADFLDVTFATLNDWTKRGLVDCGRIGTRVYYKRSSLINAISRF